MTLSTVKMTAEQFFELEDPTGLRLELVEGEVVVSPTPTWGHGRVSVRLVVLIGGYIEANDLGEIYVDQDTRFDEFTVRRPDISYYPKGREPQHHHALPPNPELCVEIISPSSEKSDPGARMKFYSSRGVANYWLLHPFNRTFEAYVLRDGVYQRAAAGADNDVVTAPPFEELSISLKRLWPPKVD